MGSKLPTGSKKINQKAQSKKKLAEVWAYVPALLPSPALILVVNIIPFAAHLLVDRLNKFYRFLPISKTTDVTFRLLDTVMSPAPFYLPLYRMRFDCVERNR